MVLWTPSVSSARCSVRHFGIRSSGNDLSTVQVETFNEIVDPSGQSDEDSYKALTALGILAAIQSLVKATFNEMQVCSVAYLKCC